MSVAPRRSRGDFSVRTAFVRSPDLMSTEDPVVFVVDDDRSM
jgi:hypothetical protein